jgi:hypothetical protein
MSFYRVNVGYADALNSVWFGGNPPVSVEVLRGWKERRKCEVVSWKIRKLGILERQLGCDWWLPQDSRQLSNDRFNVGCSKIHSNDEFKVG